MKKSVPFKHDLSWIANILLKMEKKSNTIIDLDQQKKRKKLLEIWQASV
jgi:hypothetical protein